MIRHAIPAALALTLLACGEREASRASRSDTATADTGGGTEGMGGMQMGGGQDAMASMPGMEMMPEMRRHMDSMAALPPEQMQAMMAAHQELASAMLDAMGADMRGMNMTADPAWSALTDSVKRDLADLPGLSDNALVERMREHQRRMGRLMEAHELMMR